MFKKGILLLVLLQFFSCKYFTKTTENQSKKVAKVNNRTLYLNEIKGKLPNQYSKQDSLLFVKNYINNWAKEQILFDKAELNIGIELNEINKLVEKYKKDLVINKYKEALVTKKLDTVVKKHEVIKFYNQNKNSFKLNEKLLNIRLIQILKTTEDLSEIEKLFKENTLESKKELEEKELEFKTLYLDTSKYIKENEILKFNQIIKENKDKLIQNKYLRLENNFDVFLIHINKVIERNQIAPLQYVENSIKQMILHSRKLKLIKELEKKLVNEAIKNGNFKIYE